ncbi:MAG: hypothetical protein AAF945_18585 [Actinomycetota bacterium]
MRLWTDMKRTHRSATHLLATAVTAAIALSACGTEHTNSAGGGAVGAAPAADSTEDTPVTASESTPAASSDTVPAETTSTTTSTAPTSTATATSSPSAPSSSAVPTTVAVDSASPVDAVTCGTFDQLPPRPDSMPTRLWDTDGDGADDDAVTVYGAGDGFRVRVLENGVTSEALVPPVAGFAAQIDPRDTDEGDHPRVHDLETDTVFEFATDGNGCVELVAVVEPPVSTEPIDGPCGPVLPLGPDATIATDEFHDYFNDGTPEQTITYVRDGQWFLRVVHEPGPVEMAIDDVGPGYVDVLGLADINHEMGGSEVMVRVGSTASHVKVGVFSFLEGGCLFQQRWEDESPFTFLVGATITAGEGAICHDGEIELTSYREDPDLPGTYLEGWAAFHGVDHLHFGYVPASDGFAEGLTIDEVVPAEFDCNGLPL